MKTMHLKRQRPATAGNVLIVTVMTLAVVSAFVGLAVEYTNNVGRNVQRSILLRQATNIGDASTEISFSSWRSISRTMGSTLPTTSALSSMPTPAPSDLPAAGAYTLTNYRVYPLDAKWNALTTTSATPAPIAGQSGGDLSYYYLCSADVIIPTVTSKDPTSVSDLGNVVAKVRRVFQKENLSLWRWAVFFDDDLEMHPGPLLTVNGDVHTNGSLYTGHNTLTLTGRTTFTSDWSIGFKPGDNQHPETPTSPNWPANLPPSNDQQQPPYGTTMPDYHELIESALVPKTPGLDPALASYRFENQAGVRVTIDATNNVKIYNGAGTNITALTGTSPDAKLATAFRNATTTNQTITDTREGATTGNGSVRLATLDVGAITNAINSTDSNVNISFNRVIYIIDLSADPNGVTAKRGIRLKNGASLPSGGMTIVSGNPVYVQGDYNTGSTATIQPASNTQPAPSPGATAPSPTVPGYDRKPAAIVADAVNVLSNAWLDSASGTTPPATPTTVNAGIISGNVPTGNGNYSGGVENFPRFLENWSGKAFTYYGSMIQLYKSQQAVGRWGPGYSPPIRAWYFDTNFVTSPPPGLLAAVNYRRSRWYML